MAAFQSGKENANEHYSTSATTYALLKCTVTNICRGQQTYDNGHLLYGGSSPVPKLTICHGAPDPAGCPRWAGRKANVLPATRCGQHPCQKEEGGAPLMLLMTCSMDWKMQLYSRGLWWWVWFVKSFQRYHQVKVTLFILLTKAAERLLKRLKEKRFV